MKTVHALNVREMTINQDHIPTFSASPFLSLAMDPANEQFAVGTSDGQIRVYDMTMEDSDYRLLHQVDVARILRRRREEELEQMKAAANAGIS